MGPNVSSGQIVWAGTVGPFTANVVAGLSKPSLPAPQIQLGFLVSTGDTGGTLTAKWTDVGFYGAGQASMTASDTLTGSVNASYTGYIDGTNMPFGTGTTVGTVSNHTAPGGSTTVTGTGPVAEPFSMTDVVVAVMGPNSGFSLAGFLLMASPPPPLALACATSSGEVGMPYSSSLMASGGVPPYVYSISSGSLPSGLGLNPTTGAITGTPNSIAPFAFTAQVVDSSGNSAQNTVQSNCGITITPPPTPLALSCASSAGEVGVAYSSGLVATGGISPYIFSIIAGHLPAGLMLNPTTGAISGTPTSAGPFSFTAQVIDSSGDLAINTQTSSCGVTVLPSLALACAAASGEVGVPYSSALVASGGVGPYTYSITSGALPAGLSLNPTTGAITGTPTAAGAFSFTAKVVDSSGNVGTNTVTSNCGITIIPSLSLACAASSGQVGVAYSSSLVAGGGVAPYTYAISSGSLPGGLSLNPTTGAITGTPTASGTFNFTAKAVDSSGNSATNSITSNCGITIAPAPLTLACASSTGQVGVAYSSSLVAGGGVAPYTYSISSGSLPGGLSLNPTTGAITGTPTASGTFNFTAKAVDSSGNSATNSITSNCGITVAPAPLTLACASSTGQVGVAYSSSLVAGGGVAPYTYSISSGSLPGGLSLNPTTGAITGMPTASGTFNFTAKAVDSSGNSASNSITSNCGITVAPAPLTLACASSTGQVGVAYSSSLVAGGGVSPYTYSISSGSLPGGLSLNPSTGAITGTPTASGTFNFTAKAVDSSGNSASNTVTSNCGITIAPAPLTLACASSSEQVGVAYSSSLVAGGGVAPYTYSISSGSLPGGLSLNPTTGAITGTPTASGTFNFTAKAVDSSGKTASNSITSNCGITIAPPPPAPLTVTCAASSGQVGLYYSSSLVATGGTGPYTFSISGALPSGLVLNASTGAITGTPSSEGVFNFTVKVVDSSGNSATNTVSSNCTITITTCGSSLATINYPVHESCSANQIAWFNSHLTTLGGTIPSSTFQVFITGGKIAFGPSTLSVPDAVITFSSAASCAQTSFNTALNRWETTVPLSYASRADQIFATGLAYLIPSGFPSSVSSATWSADVSSTAPGLKVAWQFGVSNWMQSNRGSSFPSLNNSPFVPDYNGLQVNAAHNAPLCSGSSSDYAGAPEFWNRGNLLVGGGGFCGSNWTGTFSSCATSVNVCSPTGPGAPVLSCPSGSAGQKSAYSSAFTVSGGLPPYLFSIVKGTLPTGLSLNASTGAITGTPTGSGSYAFTGQVTDSANPANSATVSCTITVSCSGGGWGW